MISSGLARLFVVLLFSDVHAFADDSAKLEIDGWPGTLIISSSTTVPDEVSIALKQSLRGDAPLVLISDAAFDPQAKSEIVTAWLSKHDINNVFVVNPKLPQSERWKQTETAIDAATVVWITGGQQSKLAASFHGSGIERALQRLLKRGGTVGGASAGAAIMSKVMISTGSDSPQLTEGWDLLPGAIIDQHFARRVRLVRLQIAVQSHPERFGMGIDDVTAVIIRGREMRVVGQGHVTLLLAKTVYRDAETIQLAADDHADLTQLRRSAKQRASGIDPGEPQFGRPRVESGALVIVGGGSMPEDVVNRFVELAGGETARIVVLPTAVSRNETSRQVPGFLKRAKVESVTVLTQRDDDVTSEEFQSALKSATGIWFGGGRQWNFVDAYEGTEAVELFRDVLRRGGVIGGSSAGATIQGEFLVRGHPLGNAVMMAEGYERGFALLPGTAIDQHFSQRERQPNLLPVIRQHPDLLGIGIDEGTAIVVAGTKVEVIGQHSAHFVSAKQLESIAADQPLPSLNEDAEKLYVSVKSGESADLKQLSP